jgi:hypothetical protein
MWSRMQLNSKGRQPVTNTPVAGSATSDRPSRRSLLGAGAIVAALASSGARSASAAAGTDDDVIAAFTISIELAARDLYDAAIAAGANGSLWRILREQHESAAQLVSGRSGLRADQRNDALFDSMTASMNGATRTAAAELENTLSATNIELTGMVSNTDLASAIVSIVSSEARHAVVLATLAGDGDDLDALLVNAATALSPEA